MPDATTTNTHGEYLDALLQQGLLIKTDVQGVYGKGPRFEDVLGRVNRCISEAGTDQHAEVVWFPPVVSTRLLERTDYLKPFPHLTGTVHSFFGTERDHMRLLEQVEHGEEWTEQFKGTGVALAPAACYAVYPTVSGPLPSGGRVFDVQSYCYRHEPSDDPARMQVFRIHEYVRIGTLDEIQQFGALWLQRGQELLQAMGLEAHTVVATDPFFGRGGRMIAEAQRQQELKFEIVVPICSAERPTAVMSCNYHQAHFATVFDITTSDGARAQSACVGFGLERITLALFRAHGFDTTQWPAGVRQVLRL